MQLDRQRIVGPPLLTKAAVLRAFAYGTRPLRPTFARVNPIIGVSARTSDLSRIDRRWTEGVLQCIFALRYDLEMFRVNARAIAASVANKTISYDAMFGKVPDAVSATIDPTQEEGSVAVFVKWAIPKVTPIFEVPLSVEA